MLLQYLCVKCLSVCYPVLFVIRQICDLDQLKTTKQLNILNNYYTN